MIRILYARSVFDAFHFSCDSGRHAPRDEVTHAEREAHTGGSTALRFTHDQFVLSRQTVRARDRFAQVAFAFT